MKLKEYSRKSRHFKEKTMFDWKQFVIEQILLATIIFTLLIYPQLLASMLKAI